MISTDQNKNKWKRILIQSQVATKPSDTSNNNRFFFITSHMIAQNFYPDLKGHIMLNLAIWFSHQ